MLTNKQKKLHKGTVIRNEKVSASSYYIEFETKSAFESKPGQYVSILCDNLTLRRPFSIAYKKDNVIGLLIKEKGQGTKFIKSLEPKSEIDFLGPLGNGFNISNKKSLLVGAGVGVAPIFYLKNILDEINIDNLSVAGFMNKFDIPDNMNFAKIVTNDGSTGEKGSILDHLEQFIQDYKPAVIYACGPEVVLKAISEMAQKYSIECQIAMEKIMACSIGVCRGCVIKVNKNNKVQNATVCKDGPVFDGSIIIWE